MELWDGHSRWYVMIIDWFPLELPKYLIQSKIVHYISLLCDGMGIQVTVIAE